MLMGQILGEHVPYMEFFAEVYDCAVLVVKKKAFRLDMYFDRTRN